MRYYIERLPMTIPMGVQSENNAEAVEFDVSDWLARDGSLSFSVWVTRPGEAEAYQAANATLKDGVLYWWPTGADTAIAGEGRVEILAVSANRRMLSGWTATAIRETTTETTADAPVDQRPWLDQALLASEEAKAAAASAAASADQAEGVVKKEVAALTEEIDVLSEEVGTPPVIWEQGGISGGNNTPPDYAKHNLFVRTANYIKVGNGVNVALSATDTGYAYLYDADKNYIDAVDFTESAVISPNDASYIRLRIFHRNSTVITPEYAAETVIVVYRDETTINNRIEKLFEENTEMAGRIEEVQDEAEALAEIVGAYPLIWHQGAIISGNDASDDYAYHNLFVRTANYIKVGSGVRVVFPATDSVGVYLYDADKNYIDAVDFAESSVITPIDATYIRLKVFHRNSAAIIPEYALKNVRVVYGGSLAGYKVCTYGDSITKNPTWANIVKDELNLGVVYNRGWSDSAVTMENKTLFINADGTYNSNPIGGTIQPEGTTAVQCSFCHDDRIAYVPTDSKIVLIMGGTNDMYRNKPIGEIPTDGNYDESTFAGALISTVKKIQARVPKATIILMTPIVKLSAEGATTPWVNANGDTIVDYVHAVRDAADHIGCSLIDVHNCGITLFNGADNLPDSTHPNADGAAYIAKAVISGLKRIFPN